MRFFQVNKHFWRLEATNYFVAYIHYWMKNSIKFQLDISEKKVVIFVFLSKFTEPWSRGSLLVVSSCFQLESTSFACRYVEIEKLEIDGMEWSMEMSYSPLPQNSEKCSYMYSGRL